MPPTCSSHKRKLEYTTCPACGKRVALTVWKKFFHHNYEKRRERCRYSGRRPRWL